MTTGASSKKRYAEKEVFDCSEGMVLPTGSGKFESGLLGAITAAYAGRYCLHLRPDDIWLAVSQGVSAHLQADKNAEKYRKTFVDHEGKKDILVDVTDFLTGKKTLLEWPKCVQLIVDELDDLVKGETTKVSVNDFSTTDFVAKTSSQIVLMDSMKHYFVYKMGIAGCARRKSVPECGIPSVTLHGMLADWEALTEKTRALRALNIGLDWWLDTLETVLERLVGTYRGNVDQDWWSRVLSAESGHQSGPSPQHISGWLCAFFPYEEVKGVMRRRKAIDRENPPSGLVECPFILVDARVKPGVQTDNLLVAGSCGVSVTEDGKGVMPCTGWLVKTDPSNGNKFEAAKIVAGDYAADQAERESPKRQAFESGSETDSSE
ncbi:hypothetical protein KFL_002810040 [Klebsormidium nitens]|uniref:Uncharacterized protein n=1 Tax=Klebsormidium nitens TaxID=105231 RepID=A0A1Y1IC65_KLENI|nr:hypothetical protein KFL_002810040 [Klebsormidium nitens]|eukprot:GAQ86296.1 hypothetical protein KFL_002810040 [Klebsormidium nitens]